MSVSVLESAGVVTIKINGNFDIGCYDKFNQALNSYLSLSKKFVIDLDNTTYMDSSALGMLLLLREKTTPIDIEVEFIHVNDAIMDILKVAKFDQLFTIS